MDLAKESDYLVPKNHVHHKRWNTGRAFLQRTVLISVLILLLMSSIASYVIIEYMYVSGQLYSPLNSKSGTGQHMAVRSGDCVLLKPLHPYQITGGILKSGYKLQLTIPSNSSTANVCNVPCDDLPVAIEPFKDIEPNVFNLNFSNCLDHTCFFDEFVYEAKSNVSFISYIVSVENFTPESTEFHLLAFDNIAEDLLLLNSMPLSKFPAPIKIQRMKNQTITFTLGQMELKKSSYYFFAIKLVSGSSVNQFTVNRTGVHAYYVPSNNQTIQCTVSNTNSCSIKIRTKDVCYLAYLMAGNNETNNQVSLLWYKVTGFSTTVYGHFYFSVFLIIAWIPCLLSWLWCRSKITMTIHHTRSVKAQYYSNRAKKNSSPTLANETTIAMDKNNDSYCVITYSENESNGDFMYTRNM